MPLHSQRMLAASWLMWPMLVSTAPACPKDFERTGDSCFWMTKGDHSFEACQNICNARGASLACLNRRDNMLIDLTITSRLAGDYFAVWIGLFNSGPKNGWQWSDPGCSTTFKNWLSHEPSNYCGEEDCAALTSIGYWMSISCRYTLPCLCQYPGSVSNLYNTSIASLRDDTCYSDCGDVSKWCSAWPFMRLYDVDDDICHWEHSGKTGRGRGISECISRASGRSDCGTYITYSVGRCRCSPPDGRHANCTHRISDVTSDIFQVTSGIRGARLVHASQRCVYSTDIDTEYFSSLRPATSWEELLKIWIRVAAVWLAFGVPSGCIMSIVVSRMFFEFTPCGRNWAEKDLDLQPKFQNDAAYGPILEDRDESTSNVVNRWIFRGAVGTIMYGLAQMALGGSLAAHMAGVRLSYTIELMEAMAMGFSVALVARAAQIVHRHLSASARQVAGPWVLIFALAKFGLAFGALGFAAIFSTLADEDYENACFAEYLFRWSLLMTLPFQCIAGFSVWSLQNRARRYAGSIASVGGWVNLVVLGTFGSGFGVWWAGYLGCVHEASNPVLAACFIVAAMSSLIAGVSLLSANCAVKAHYSDLAKCRDDVVPEQVGNSRI